MSIFMKYDFLLYLLSSVFLLPGQQISSLESLSLKSYSS